MDLTKNLKIESVCRLNMSTPVTLSPRDSVRQAVAVMQQHRIGCVVVVQDGKLAGIFTERDLLKRIVAVGRPLSLTLAECMTAKPVTVRSSDPIGKAMRCMTEGGYRHLPVLDEQDRVVGVLSVRRIVRYLVEHFPQTVYNQPPDPNAVQKDRDGA
ncbi:MAG: CBS domain-containing protein [Gemmatales bacterium]|nr:CBS domain-containing protein [Gemmatales bacterium]MDW8386454.1 CBS domain-containing protein [Gemmatales bacterium]